jgi:hypothetical protein
MIMNKVHYAILTALQDHGPKNTSDLAIYVARQTHADVNEVIASMWDLEQDAQVSYSVTGHWRVGG